MLASLLPGLRDVRTPLTVGYLWLTFAWVIWGDRIPDDRPQGDGLIARLYDISGFFGNATLLAALSFVAYVLGAMVTIPVEGGLAPILVGLPQALTGPFKVELAARVTRNEFYAFLLDKLTDDRLRQEAAFELISGGWAIDTYEMSPDPDGRTRIKLADVVVAVLDPHDSREPVDYLSSNERRALTASPEVLRPRLLASGKTEVYGEYDRQAAEGSFRVNIAIPVLALSIAIGIAIAWFLIPIGLVVALLLLVQGSNRIAASLATIQRAAINNLFVHPWTEALARRDEGTAADPSKNSGK